MPSCANLLKFQQQPPFKISLKYYVQFNTQCHGVVVRSSSSWGTVSQIWKKSAFSFWVEILGENMLEEPSNTIVSFLVKNEGNIFFHFLPYKTCKLGATGHGPRGLAGMKIMKIILCYCAQWCCSSWFLKLKAPSSFEIFNFLTVTDRRLKIWQNNVLMSTSFLKLRRATSLGAIIKYNLHNFHSG